MTIDANIIIAYLKADEPVIQTLTRLSLAGTSLILSTIVESEVLSFPGLTKSERERIETFLTHGFLSVPFDRQIARLAAEIRRSHKIKLPDAAIAATAMVTHTPLITRNVKDFQPILGLQLVTI